MKLDQSTELIQPVLLRDSVLATSPVHLAALVWTKDNHIKLFTSDPQDPASVPIFDVPIASIEKVGGGATQLLWYVNGKKYRTDFFLGTYTTPDVLALVNPGGRFADMLDAIKTSGIDVWVEELKTVGARVTYKTTQSILWISMGVALGIIVVASIIVLLTTEW